MTRAGIILDIIAALILLGLFLAGVYEAIAIINLNIKFTPDFPTITSIIRPWVAANRKVAILIAALILAAFFWLFFHFYLPE